MDARLAKYLENLKKVVEFDPESNLPEGLVVHPEQAEWIGEEVTHNPSSIGVMLDVPARSMEFILQEIPPGASSDLQRHLHESVHYVIEGSGYSEIGPETVEWGTGDFVYTPVWVWHRHYNNGENTVKMLLIENSRLLEPLGLNRRESAGLISYEELREKQR